MTIWPRPTGRPYQFTRAHRATCLSLVGLVVALAVVGCTEDLPSGSPAGSPTEAPLPSGSPEPMGTFVATGSMTVRYYQSATLLSNGQVLIAGGSTDISGLGDASAELFDPAKGTFTQTGSMTIARMNQSATLLADGRVLIAGGSGDASAELYDPATGNFSAIGPMVAVRSQSIATLLADGRVLILGGAADPLSAELYDPRTGKFTKTGSMTAHDPFTAPAAPATDREGRPGATATLLLDGRVLVAGGAGLDSAEIYNPATGFFTATGSMSVGRSDHTATLLTDGRVLITGGRVIGLSSLDTAELYDPKVYDPVTKTNGAFVRTGTMTTNRTTHTATLLPNGRVLIVGGAGSGASAEFYNPRTGAFSAAGALVSDHSVHTATLLQDGRVLIAGGNGGYGSTVAAELYRPWAPAASPSPAG